MAVLWSCHNTCISINPQVTFRPRKGVSMRGSKVATGAQCGARAMQVSLRGHCAWEAQPRLLETLNSSEATQRRGRKHKHKHLCGNGGLCVEDTPQATVRGPGRHTRRRKGRACLQTPAQAPAKPLEREKG